jgi:hypothetical protein
MTFEHERKDALCSPFSIAMVVRFFTRTSCCMYDLVEGVYDYGLDVYGSWPFNIAHAFNTSDCKLTSRILRLKDFHSVYTSYLRHDIPLIVSVRGPLVGGATPYAGGHLLVIVGFDNQSQEVICHDPAFATESEVEVRYPLKNFIRAWERSRRLVYEILPIAS